MGFVDSFVMTGNTSLGHWVALPRFNHHHYALLDESDSLPLDLNLQSGPRQMKLSGPRGQHSPGMSFKSGGNPDPRENRFILSVTIKDSSC